MKLFLAILNDITPQSYARYCKSSLKSRSVLLFQLLYNKKKESLGNSLYELFFYESGRQDSNLRPSALKALGGMCKKTPRL